MKKITLITLCLVASFISFAQDTVMIYYDVIWKETTRDKAQYERKKFKSGNGWGVIDYYHSGKIQMNGTYADDSCLVRNGLFTWYFEKTGIEHVCNYKDNKADGSEILYYENGSKKIEGNNRMGTWDGDWIGYYPNGNISAKVKYKNNEQVAGKFYTEGGKLNPDIKLFYRAAEYPGGSASFGRYLYHTLIYPADAQKKEIQGTVVVGFMVGKDGILADFKIDKSVEASLDAEALRVLKQMPTWTPCISGGILIDYYFKQPVTFKLEAQ